MNHLQKHLSASLIALAALLSGAPIAAWAVAATAPALGAAADFAVLSGGGPLDAVKTVTCTDSTVIGDVGGPFATASPTNCTFLGQTAPATNAAAANAQAALTTAYNSIQNETCTTTNTLSGSLAGQTVTPGVYCIDDVAKAGTLTLNGSSTDIWIFKTILTPGEVANGTNGALTGTTFTVTMTGGGLPCNVFWAPLTAATMTTSAFKGNILAGNSTVGSITLTGGTLAGRALASVAITMTNAAVTGCAALSGGLVCVAPPKLNCDTNHQHHKNCKLHDYDPPHCDGNDDGHDGNQKSWSSNPWSNDKH